MGRPSGPDEMYCPQCGELIDRDSQFCTYCGTGLGGDTTQQSTESGGTRRQMADQSSRDGSAIPPSARRRGRGRGHSGRHEANGQQPPPGASGSHSGQTQTPAGPPAQTHAHDGRRGNRPQQRPPQPNAAATPDSEGRGFGTTRIGAESLSFPSTTESPLRAIGVAVGLGAAGILILVAFSIVIGGIGLGAGLPDPVVLVVATGIGQYVGFVGLAVLYLRRRGYEWPDVRSYVGLRFPTLKELAIFVVGLVGMYILLFFVAGIVAQFLPEPAENQGAEQLTSSTSTLAYVGAVAFMFLVVGPCEEFLFRGLVQNRLRERFTAAPAILVASVVFASVHVIAVVGSPPSAILVTITILFVPALVLGGVYEYTGNLVVPWLLHSTHNSLIVTLLFFGPESAQMLSWVGTVLL